QFLLGALLLGDVVEHHHVQDQLAVLVVDRARLDLAQELLAVLAPLPDLAVPAALAPDLPADVLVERGVVLEAVEHAGVAADDVVPIVAGHAQERGVDRDEIEVAVDHRHRLVHAAQHFAGDAQLAVGLAGAGDVERGSGDALDAALGVARDRAAAGAHPYPFAAVVGHAQFGQERIG